MKKTLLTIAAVLTLTFGFSTNVHAEEFEDYASCTSEEVYNFQLSMVGEFVLSAMAETGWTITLTDEDVDQLVFGGKYTAMGSKVYGATIFDQKTIYISDDTYSTWRSTIHEVGHFVDAYCGRISRSDAWYDIYEAEKDLFVNHETTTGYHKSNPCEYWAEAYRELIKYPEELAANAPMTYGFMVTCLTQLGIY